MIAKNMSFKIWLSYCKPTAYKELMNKYGLPI